MNDDKDKKVNKIVYDNAGCGYNSCIYCSGLGKNEDGSYCIWCCGTGINSIDNE